MLNLSLLAARPRNAAPPSRRRERGQVLMMTALLLPILLGFAALAVDVGSYADHRRTMQNAADSIALAASHDLPDPSATRLSANKWAVKNDIDPNDMTVTILPVGNGTLNPTVRVVVTEPHQFSFARILGIDSKPVGARAAAIKTSPGGGANLLPFAVTLATQIAAEPGDPVTLKYDSNDPTAGNFGIIRLDGSGSNVYKDTIMNGSDSTVCVYGVTTCQDTSPVCDQSVCQSQTGNLVGATRDGVDYRINNTDAECDTFDEVLNPGTTAGTFVIEKLCNPWIDGGYSSLRLVVVPVIQNLCNGSCDYTIVKFALFFLDGYEGGKCTGSVCEIKGRFVNADATIGALSGTYDPTAPIHFTRLSE